MENRSEDHLARSLSVIINEIGVKTRAAELQELLGKSNLFRNANFMK